MNQRDKAIVADIQRFRVLSRDLIASLHFQHVKFSITAANNVLKRLYRDKHIERSTDRRQYLYFPAENFIKKDSAKLGHFLQIAEFYRDLCKVEVPKVFIVEPKYDKGFPEPDVFMIFKGYPWHVEIQRTQYSDKQMKEKLQRYDHYYLSNSWQGEPWQLKERKLYPYLWITGVGKYNIGIRSYKVFQNTIEEMAEITRKK